MRQHAARRRAGRGRRWSSGNILLPHFPVPAGRDRGVVPAEAGAARVPGSATAIRCPPPVVERLEYELRVIEDMGFPAYFLIVWDLIRYAREQGIRTGPARGSAGGSIVSLLPADHRPRSAGLRADLRALPQPGPAGDARHRHGLRRAVPVRDDPLRLGALRLRPRGPDRHLLDDQGAPGAARLGAGARICPTRVGDRVAKAMPPAILGREATLAQCTRAARRRCRRRDARLLRQRRRPARAVRQSTPTLAG